MRKLFITLTVIALTANIFAQFPQKISYQAVIRNTSNNLVVNHAIGMRVSILKGSVTGTEVYKEIYNPNPQTNDNGLVSIEIGSGIPITGTFASINWANGPYFVKTETDPTGGTNYTINGTSQLLSVPYALYAKTAENITGTFTETDPIYTSSQAANITAAHITKLGNLSGVNTGDQDLSGLATTSSVTTALNLKVDKIAGKGLSTNDYSNADATKLAGIASGAEVNINADWNALSGDAKILNKPVGANPGDMLYWNGSSWVIVPVGQNSNVLTLVNGVPTWLGKVTDIEGSIYNTVTIGTQVWMASNLKTTKFNDNTAIPLVTDNTAWGNLVTPAYCWYNDNEAANKNTYGALYNWYTVNTGKLCPTGWHVPTDADWTQLITYLGGETIAGGKLKEAGTSHWNNPNNATNETGFSALPAGIIDYNGTFVHLGEYGFWWSSSEFSASFSWSRDIYYAYPEVYRGNYAKVDGFSVRCVKY